MFRSLTAISLCLALLASVAGGQTQPSPPPAAGASTLKLRVLQGSDVVNNIQTGTVTPPVVEVRDENEIPLEAADVTFKLPASGPGGVFPDGKFTYATKTNSQGQAACARFQPGSQAGRFDILVTVTFRGRTSTVTVRQTNSQTDFATERRHTSKVLKKKWLIVGGLVIGGAVGAVLATRSSGSGTVYSISTGGVGFGPPR